MSAAMWMHFISIVQIENFATMSIKAFYFSLGREREYQVGKTTSFFYYESQATLSLVSIWMGD